MTTNTVPCTSNCGVKNHEIGSTAHLICQQRTTAMKAHPAGKGRATPQSDFTPTRNIIADLENKLFSITDPTPEQEQDPKHPTSIIEYFHNLNNRPDRKTIPGSMITLCEENEGENGPAQQEFVLAIATPQQRTRYIVVPVHYDSWEGIDTRESVYDMYEAVREEVTITEYRRI